MTTFLNPLKDWFQGQGEEIMSAALLVIGCALIILAVTKDRAAVKAIVLAWIVFP